MKKKTGLKKVISLITIQSLVIVGVCLLLIPIFDNLKFGLDLQGGFEILYRAESVDGSKMNSEKLTATYKTLSKRIDSLGVSEPEIILEGNDRIRVKLAGVTNPEEARSQLSTVASLSFRDTEDNLLMTSDVLKAGGAKISEDESGSPAVLLSVKDKDKFYEVTSAISKTEDQMIVIWLDYNNLTDSYEKEGSLCGSNESNCLSAATVSQGFASDVIIQGNFTEEEVSNLVDLINSGSLPSKLVEVSSKTVGASFGDNTLEKTFLAGVIGITAIILVLIFIYHFAGFISAVSIMLYTLATFFVFWVVGGVLTLPGIAALVLGIGMAVDSNVITYSRIRDELHKGKSLSTAFKDGSKESFGAILDGNLTTLIVGIIMFVFGESSIKGFATMNIISVIVTMFTMVFITRWLMGMFVKTGYFDNKTNFFINVKKKNIPNVSKGEEVKVVPFKNVNFLKYSKYCIAASLLVILAGGIMIGTKGLNLGIDYKAGTSVVLVTEEEVSKKEIKEDIKSLGLKEESIEMVDGEIDIRISKALGEEEVKEVNTFFEEKYDAKVNIGVVSNIVKQELVKNAILSVLVALVGIIVYVAIRFRMSYAIAGVVTLVHDVAIVFALFAMLRYEVASMFIAAILAIIGYSINDTIVNFDRIRENLSKKKNKKLTVSDLREEVNLSIRQTFDRTIYTSLTTLLPILALLFLGSREILTFNMAMLFGLIVGSYSSIYISVALFMLLEKRNLNKPKKDKKIYTDEFQEKKIKGINC